MQNPPSKATPLLPNSAKHKSARRGAIMGHDAAVLHVGIALVIDVARSPIVDDALVALVDVVLAAVVHGHLERELVAGFVSRAEGGEVELVAFGVVVIEGVGVRVTATSLAGDLQVDAALSGEVNVIAGVIFLSTMVSLVIIRSMLQVDRGVRRISLVHFGWSWSCDGETEGQ